MQNSLEKDQILQIYILAKGYLDFFFLLWNINREVVICLIIKNGNCTTNVLY